MAAGQETEVVGFQFDHIEDGQADRDEHHTEENDAQCQGSGIYGEKGSKRKSHRPPRMYDAREPRNT